MSVVSPVTWGTGSTDVILQIDGRVVETSVQMRNTPRVVGDIGVSSMVLEPFPSQELLPSSVHEWTSRSLGTTDPNQPSRESEVTRGTKNPTPGPPPSRPTGWETHGSENDYSYSNTHCGGTRARSPNRGTCDSVGSGTTTGSISFRRNYWKPLSPLLNPSFWVTPTTHHRVRILGS